MAKQQAVNGRRGRRSNEPTRDAVLRLPRSEVIDALPAATLC